MSIQVFDTPNKAILAVKFYHLSLLIETKAVVKLKILCGFNSQVKAQGQTMMGVAGQNFGVGHLCAI